MMNFYLRLAYIPIVLLTAVLVLFRAQPYDDHELRQLLTPDDCAAPCFMGIRPGVTTSKEALAILQQHEWVASIHVIDVENPYQILWSWSENAPVVLRNPSLTFNGEVVTSNEKIVSAVIFSPQWVLGDVILTWGIPPDSQTTVGVIPLASPWRYTPVELAYQAQGFRANGILFCPFRSRLWTAPTRLEITNQFHGIATGAVYAINQGTFFSNLRETSTRMCGA